MYNRRRATHFQPPRKGEMTPLASGSESLLHYRAIVPIKDGGTITGTTTSLKHLLGRAMELGGESLELTRVAHKADLIKATMVSGGDRHLDLEELAVIRDMRDYLTTYLHGVEELTGHQNVTDLFDLHYHAALDGDPGQPFVPQDTMVPVESQMPRDSVVRLCVKDGVRSIVRIFGGADETPTYVCQDGYWQYGGEDTNPVDLIILLNEIPRPSFAPVVKQ